MAESRPATLLETDGDGVVVDGRAWSIWQTLEDARRDKQETVALYRGKERFDVRTDVKWRVKDFDDGA